MSNTNLPDSLSIVIKLGTSTLTCGSQELNRAHMLEIVRVIAKLKQLGHRVTLVSSGAMAAGRELIKDYKSLPPLLSSKQLLASVGQGRLIEVWESLFAIYNINIGQILLTRADLEDRNRFLNAKDTLFALLDHNIVPIINENDALSTAEIKLGDNDTLSAITASAIGADKLILLTDQKGLYEEDPRVNPQAKLIYTIEQIDDKILALASDSKTNLGTGGMVTKLKAASIATSAGVEMIIASGANVELILDLIQGKQVEATIFKTSQNPKELRKVWLASSTKPSGAVVVDNGAINALTKQNSSLLPSGICKIKGEFMRGAVVAIEDLNGSEVGKGIARYNSIELNQIMGCKSDEIEKRLGFSHGVAIHRNDLVMN